jgi:hypothetical protein
MKDSVTSMPVREITVSDVAKKRQWHAPEMNIVPVPGVTAQGHTTCSADCATFCS